MALFKQQGCKFGKVDPPVAPGVSAAAFPVGVFQLVLFHFSDQVFGSLMEEIVRATANPVEFVPGRFQVLNPLIHILEPVAARRIGIEKESRSSRNAGCEG